MPRDYKHRSGRQKKKNVPGWAWLLVGLMIGLFVAFLVYLKEHQRVALPTDSSGGSGVTGARSDPAGTDSARDRRPPRPRFEFYTVLPEMEVPVPEEELPTRGSREQTESKEAATYLLQVASFRSHQEADRLKASLALLGMEAKIQTVTIDSKQTWHRVRLGPFSSLADAHQMRRQLRENDFDAIVLKVKA